MPIRNTTKWYNKYETLFESVSKLEDAIGLFDCDFYPDSWYENLFEEIGVNSNDYCIYREEIQTMK